MDICRGCESSQNQTKTKAPPKLASLRMTGRAALKGPSVSTVDDRASIDASIFHVDPACAAVRSTFVQVQDSLLEFALVPDDEQTLLRSVFSLSPLHQTRPYVLLITLST